MDYREQLLQRERKLLAQSSQTTAHPNQPSTNPRLRHRRRLAFFMHEACVCVSTRAARPSATATAALIEHAQLDQVRARLRARVRVSPYPNPTLTLSP